MSSSGRRLRDVLLSALVLTHLAYSWMFSDVTVPNERTRAYLAAAIVDDGTIRVDGSLKRYGRVYDLATFDGHYFTDKAPGSSFLAVPVYGVAKRLHPGDFTVVELINLFRTWLMLPVGLLGFWLLRALLRRLRVSDPTVDIISLGWILGTSAFHYSTAFYGHGVVAALLPGALLCLARADLFERPETGAPVPSSARDGWIGGAGALAGLMGLSEYQAVLVSALLALPIAMGPPALRLRGLFAFALGALPFAVTLLAYNARAFGGPLELSYHHLVGSSLQDLHSMGLAGATRPTWTALVGLTLSAHRGLIATSPLMAVGLLGLAVRYKHMPRALALTVGLSVGYFVLIVASSSVWFGGWSFGPRLLVPITSLLALVAAISVDSLRANPLAQGLTRAAIIFGVLYHQLVHAVFPELPASAVRPLPDIVMPMLKARVVSPNLMCKLVPLAASNLIPLAVSVAFVVLFVAFRGTELLRARVSQGACAIGIAVVAFVLLGRAAPSMSALEQQKWLRLVHTFEARETRCLRSS